MKKYGLLTLVLIFFLSLVSCKKGPGLGGEASISGKVRGVVYDKSFTKILDSSSIANWTMCIIYGSDLEVDGTQKTTYDGTFDFQYLREGQYTVYTYSRSHLTNLADSAVAVNINISGKKQSYVIPDLVIYR